MRSSVKRTCSDLTSKSGLAARVVLQMLSNQIISTQSKAKVTHQGPTEVLFAQLTFSSLQNALFLCVLGPIFLKIEFKFKV